MMGMGSVISLHLQNIEGCFAQFGFGPLGKMARGEFPQAIDMQNHVYFCGRGNGGKLKRN